MACVQLAKNCSEMNKGCHLPIIYPITNIQYGILKLIINVLADSANVMVTGFFRRVIVPSGTFRILLDTMSELIRVVSLVSLDSL